MSWIGWVVSIGTLVTLVVLIVVDEIRFDRDLARYQKQRDLRLRQLLGDIHKS